MFNLAVLGLRISPGVIMKASNNMSAAIVSWHPLLTDHQAYTLEALGEAANVQMTVNVTKNQDAVRKAQGWTETSVRTLTIQLIPKTEWLSFILQQLRERRNSIHLFGSPFEQPKLMLVLFLAIRMGLRVYIISEPYSPIAAGYLEEGKRFSNKVKSWLRPLIYRIYGLVLKKHIEGVFAISPLAVTQYSSMGIEDERIFPFGYFVPSTATGPAKSFLPSSLSSNCRIIFVGSLITRKGLDLLIDAAKRLYALGVSFQIDVYGHGDPDSFGFDNAYIKYAGKIPFGQAQSIIAKYDSLVLPSRYDGWGVVVNEALLAGVPVVCSDRVGAGAIVKKWGCGSVYRQDVADALFDTLFSFVSDSDLRRKMRVAALNIRASLAPTIAGTYMANVLENYRLNLPKPINPWY